MPERRHYNRKRRIVEPPPEVETLFALATQVRYVGSPYHKKYRGDFGLSPPAQPRPDKTLCDEAGITGRAIAQELLEQGVRKGLISPDHQAGFPRYIWAVAENGVAFEARYNNEGPGNYHGYPLFGPDPFRDKVAEVWKRRSPPPPVPRRHRQLDV